MAGERWQRSAVTQAPAGKWGAAQAAVLGGLVQGLHRMGFWSLRAGTLESGLATVGPGG